MPALGIRVNLITVPRGTASCIEQFIVYLDEGTNI